MSGMMQRLVGNETVKQALLAAMQSGRLAHSILFCAEEGCGAGFAARCLAADFLYPDNPDAAERVVQGKSPDVLVLEKSGAAGEIKIDDVRDVRREVYATSLSAAGRVVLVKGAHRLNASSANALLKVMEEPPEGVMFLLTAPDEASVMATIKSRCCMYTLAPVSQEECEKEVRRLVPDGQDVPALCRAFGGRIGSVLRALTDEDEQRVLQSARQMMQAVATRDEYTVLAQAALYEKDRAGGQRLCMMLAQLCAAELFAPQTLTGDAAARVVNACTQAQRQLAQNANAKAVWSVFGARVCL